MTARLSTPDKNPVSLNTRIILYATSCALFFAAASPIFFRSNSEFDGVFKTYARILLQGEDIYHPGSTFMYPPWMAFATIPFTFMPHWASRLSWGIVNIFFLYLSIYSAWKISVTVSPNTFKFGWVAFVTGLICSATYFLNCLSHQQFDVIIAGTLLFGCLQLSKNKEITGGFLLGAGAACKLTPLLFIPYLIYRFKWKGLLSLVAGFFLCNLISDFTLGLPKEGIPRLFIFADRFLAPMTKPDYIPGTWGTEIIYNQSLAGTIKRFTQSHLEKTEGKYSVVVENENSRALQVKYFLLGLVILGTGFTLFCWGLPGRVMPNEDSNTKPNNIAPVFVAPAFAMEISMIFCAMLLLSPMSGMAHFGILILPAFCLARMLEYRHKIVAILFLAIPVLVGLLLNKDLSGSNNYTILLWLGGLTCATISLFLGNGILVALLRNKQTSLTNHQDQYSSK